MTRKDRTSVHVIMIDFLPARYVAGKRPYIVWYQTNPNSLIRERWRDSFDLGRIAPEKRADAAAMIIKTIDARLPFGYPYDQDLYESKVTMLAEPAINYSLVLCRGLRNATIRTYSSVTRKFLKFLQEKNYDQLPIGSLSTRVAEMYSARLLEEGLLPVTHNKNITALHSIFAKLVKKKIITTNIWKEIEQLKEGEKKRIPVPEDHIPIILDYLRKNDVTVYTACLLQFYTMVRPNEMRQMRRSNFDLQKSIIIIQSDVSKNGKNGVTTIPDEFMGILIDLKIESLHSTDYLLREKTHLGSKKPLSKNALGHRYRLAIKFLHRSGHLKNITGNTLYSWKDTGNDYLSDNVTNALKWMNQNRHQSLDETQKYLSKRKVADQDVKENHRLPTTTHHHHLDK
ncbi:MAG TPA: phage integrase N-terminal SAM-like domain-containing protein [Saprospiraceae bacterium]|nr:phage integrase N-terminal SAM-like domain-containing protein [Saprospiraceae bacterium]